MMPDWIIGIKTVHAEFSQNLYYKVMKCLWTRSLASVQQEAADSHTTIISVEEHKDLSVSVLYTQHI